MTIKTAPLFSILDSLGVEPPTGWTWATVRQVIELVQYGTSTKADADGKTGVPMLRMGNIQEGFLDLDDLKYIDRDSDEVDRLTLRRGDILFNRTNSPELVGKSAVFNSDLKATFASYLIRLRCEDGLILPDYLCRWINSLWGREWAEAVRTDGVSQSNINSTKLLEMEVPLPPLEEQKRIMARVEALVARVNAAQERLERVPAIIRSFRQSVLAAACSGKLTGEWRRGHREIEGSQSLIERIGGVLIRELTPNVFTHLDDSALFELPAHWAWASLGSLGKWSGGGTPSKDRAAFWGDGTIPWVTPKDMKVLRIRDSQDHITQAGVEAARLKIAPPGSLLMVVRGMILAHTFPVAITDSPVTVNQDMRVLQPHEGMMGRFLLLALQQASGGLLNEVKESTHGTRRVESEVLLNWPVAIPPLDEELEIVRRVECLFRLADEIEVQVSLGTARADKLTQAILAKAFRGELVTTEAELARREGREYESASALLSRIAKGQRND